MADPRITLVLHNSRTETTDVFHVTPTFTVGLLFEKIKFRCGGISPSSITLMGFTVTNHPDEHRPLSDYVALMGPVMVGQINFPDSPSAGGV